MTALVWLARNPMAAAATVLLMILAVMSVYANSVRLEAVALTARLGEANAKIEAQNAAIEVWKATAANEEAKVRRAEEDAAKLEPVIAEKVARIKAEPVPSACHEAMQWGARKAVESSEGWR